MSPNSRPFSGWDTANLTPTPPLDDQIHLFNYDEPAPTKLQTPAHIVNALFVTGKPGYAQPLHNTSEPTPNGKVAIPRVANKPSRLSGSRVSRACEGCRELKAKCSGDRPTCRRCLASNAVCVYDGRKGEKMARKIDELTYRLRTYENILSNAHPLLSNNASIQNESTAGEVRARDLERQIFSPENNQASGSTPQSSDISREFGKEKIPELPIESIAYTNQDFNRSENQATGYLGPSSAISWLYSLRCRLHKNDGKQVNLDCSGYPSLASVNYSLDELNIPLLQISGEPDWPSRAIANKLLDSYFKTTHASFPFIGKILFLKQYRTFYSSPNSRPGNRWLAVLNMIFAIASLYSCLTEGCVGENAHEHRVYFSRAWQLSMGTSSLLDSPNLQQVQVEGLMSLYLLSAGYVNRACRLCQTAINSAVIMGINLHNESFGISQVSRESRYRLWWALYLLDTKLRVMTGRPSCISKNSYTTPLPLPYKEEDFQQECIMRIIGDSEARKQVVTFILSPQGKKMPETRACNPSVAGSSWHDKRASSPLLHQILPSGSLYLLYVVDLATIIRDAVDALYSPGAAVASWIEVESTITGFNYMIDGWLSRLPSEYDFSAVQENQLFICQRTALAFHFYSAKLVLLEPCLRTASLLQQYNPSIGFDKLDTMAALCMHEAGRMIDLLPATPDKTWLYEHCPWWCVLHHIMQSSIILLAGLLGGIYSERKDAVATEQKIKKACRWLKEIATSDIHSQRAWAVYRDTIFHHVPQLASEMESPEF